VIALLNREINRSLASPELKSRLDAEGAEAAPGTPEAFGTMIVQEITRWKPVIEQSHMKVE
jgi:tripartite-type tricarboxylate transporter receptor subunit TctC